ncbi:p53 and DNA damage-regulated protein 1-like isoform X2 [Dreissena polymorpha]|uniref:p53 and DNA damage-regulated protein 1-like isoform X2 n=1 Tax=Dreissena polymorpha TaxID=45954 RepID=UPI0022647961|nr:p53 and DNA damage-regulated protein 1-like isoform X2 [Dreissena polymorpha]
MHLFILHLYTVHMMAYGSPHTSVRGHEGQGKVMELMYEMEMAAEDILTDKQQIIDLDRKRQKTREAIRVLSKDHKSDKHWVCVGNMFLKLPAARTKTVLNEDFNKLDGEINSLRTNLKQKVNKLRDLEMKEDIKGFNLTPLSKSDLQHIDNYF